MTRSSTLKRLMPRLHLGDQPLHASHDPCEVGLGGRLGDAEALRPADLAEQAYAADQRLGGDAAGVETVSAQPMALDQRHLRLQRRCQIGTHQTTRAGADHHQITIEAMGSRPASVDPPSLDPGDQPGGQGARLHGLTPGSPMSHASGLAALSRSLGPSCTDNPARGSRPVSDAWAARSSRGVAFRRGSGRAGDG